MTETTQTTEIKTLRAYTGDVVTGVANANNEILGMSHSYFFRRDVNPDNIREFVQKMKLAYPDTELDETWLFNKLESIHSETNH